jgi:hypothetical protein
MGLEGRNGFLRMIPQWMKLSRKAHVYKAVFDTPEGKIVLADLIEFCHLQRSAVIRSVVTGAVDPYSVMQAEGKRDVLMRIMKYVNLSYAEVLAMKGNEEQFEVDNVD